MNRWSTPKKYKCMHTDCPDAAVILEHGANVHKAHNCCGTHEEGAEA